MLLLQEAERAGITIDQRSVPLKELQACMLAGSHLIIALVDKRRLCSGLMWSRPASLQIGGVNRMPIICGYGDAYTGVALMSPAVAMQLQAETVHIAQLLAVACKDSVVAPLHVCCVPDFSDMQILFSQFDIILPSMQLYDFFAFLSELLACCTNMFWCI